jgi:methylmalonyl-CoA decarboxylase
MPLIRTSLADGIGTLAFDNYAHRNALSAAVVTELLAALAEMRETARAVILRSAAKNPVWSAGHDLHELAQSGQDPLGWHDPLEQLLRAVADFPAPVIAMIDGSVWGGACDLEAASFCFVPAKLGLPYNLSGVQRFVTRLPPNIAMEMACTAEPFDAQRALHGHLLNQLVPVADLETRTYSMAKTIAGRHREAIAAFKAQARLVLATLSANPERLEYLEAIRQAAYAPRQT